MDKKPYQAVILLNIEVQDVLPTGELSGRILKSDELEKFGLRKNMVVSVEGFDKFECLKKLKEKIDEFKKP